MYHDTVTVFNRQKNKAGDIWFPTILTGVNVNVDRGAIVKVYGEQSEDNMILNVPYTQRGPWLYIAAKDGVKEWFPPKEWQRLEQHETGVTFTAGNAFDFVWLGEWTGGGQIPDDYGDKSFYDYMLSMYDYVFAITSVGSYSVIPHFEITGR